MNGKTEYQNIEWLGCKGVEFEFQGFPAKVIKPNCEPNGKWLLKTEYFDAFPMTESVLLGRGWHLAYIKNANRWAQRADIDRKADFIRFVSAEFELESKCTPVGMSCGGLFGAMLAAKYPELIDVLYLDAPVLNLLSCPGDMGDASGGMLAEFMGLTGMTKSQLICYRDHPIDNVHILVENDIPLVLVAGLSDTVVPYHENGKIFEDYYKSHGGRIKTFLKDNCGHHPHGMGGIPHIANAIEEFAFGYDRMKQDYSGDVFDIILLAGQSNAEGTGMGDVEVEWIPDGDILQLNAPRVGDCIGGNKWQWFVDFPLDLRIEETKLELHEQETVHRDSLALHFAKKYKESGLLEKGRRILIVNAPLGGTSFVDKHWTPDGRLYLRMVEMLKYAIGLNPENRVVAMLWHQGESDAIGGLYPENGATPPDEYYAHLKGLIESVRELCDNAELPVVTGDFVPLWNQRNAAATAPIVEATKRVTTDLGGAFVHTDGLISNAEVLGNGDDIHFCRNSVHELGVRYFDGYMSVRKDN
ncbi:MAG: hypothetical protein E7589_07450 [Ruminococcaceae bacterium]|nr:hypothetical protein [Oscillospiraceae bacterium]